MPFIASVEGTFGYGRQPQTSFVAFNYSNFANTTGLTLSSVYGVVNNLLFLTSSINDDVGNVYRSTAIPYNRNFSFEWNFQCSGGSSPPADGFCLQWTTTDSTNGGAGGGVGYVTTAYQALTFLTYTNSNFTWYKQNVVQTTVNGQNFFQNLFYWAEYTQQASTLNIYFSSVYVKPATPNFPLTGFLFDSTPYYIGFGAATGGANADHILRSMKLTFT